MVNWFREIKIPCAIDILPYRRQAPIYRTKNIIIMRSKWPGQQQ